MVDDTCYQLDFENFEEAKSIFYALESDEIRSLIHSLVFKDAKRVITKSLLMRLDLALLCREKGVRINSQRFNNSVCNQLSIFDWRRIVSPEFGTRCRISHNRPSSAKIGSNTARLGRTLIARVLPLVLYNLQICVKIISTNLKKVSDHYLLIPYFIINFVNKCWKDNTIKKKCLRCFGCKFENRRVSIKENNDESR